MGKKRTTKYIDDEIKNSLITKRMNDILSSPAFLRFSQYNSQLEAALEQNRRIQAESARISKAFELVNSRVIESLRETALASFNSITPNISLVQAELGIVSASRNWSEQIRIVDLFAKNLHISSLATISQTFLELHSSIFESVSKKSVLPEWTNIYIRNPTIDLAIHQQAVQTYYPVEEIDIDDESEISEEEREDYFSEVESNISSLSVELLIPLRGAEQAIRSRNPDKVRHAVNSLRELVGHVLRIVAPSNEIEDWSTESKYYHDGKPTRSARVAFLCRKSQNNKLRKLIEADMKSVGLLFDAFNSGTHKIVSEYTDDDLLLLLLRTKSFVNYIIELSGM